LFGNQVFEEICLLDRLGGERSDMKYLKTYNVCGKPAKEKIEVRN
jgi:hypothetical protein